MPKLPLNLVLLRSYDVLGIYWGAWAARDPAGHKRQYGADPRLVRGRENYRRMCRRSIR